MEKERIKYFKPHVLSKLREQGASFADTEACIKALSGCVAKVQLIEAYKALRS